MALGNLFKLAKLTIDSYYDVKRTQRVEAPPSSRNPFEVMYNPETLSTHHESVFARPQGPGGAGQPPPWLYSPAKDLSVKLVIDGTDVSDFGVQQARPSVAEQIRALLLLCYVVRDKSHEPAFLRVSWGAGIFGARGFECRLQSLDIQYTAFDRDGSPLRADLSARFVEALDPKNKDRELRLSSPDLTHRRVVRSGDTLPLLCREIYGSASHYLRVAQINGLDDFRELVPGQELIFPPFARREGR